MGDRLRFTVLGCGSSPGVPRPMGDWGACEPSNPKNRRRRPALLVQRVRADGALTNVVIDTGPDFREQMLSAGVGRLDAVVYTHAHADHIHGIDDLRSYFLAQRQRIPVYADAPTQERLFAGFGYCFATQPGSSYPPILDANDIEAGAKINHFSYIGDADVGTKANVGAGTIVCNYDGVFKHRSRIGARAFIGSNSALVAPVEIGDDALVAAGSVITEDVPGAALALGRGRQVIKPGLGLRLMERLRALKAAKAGE